MSASVRPPCQPVAAPKRRARATVLALSLACLISACGTRGPELPLASPASGAPSAPAAIAAGWAQGQHDARRSGESSSLGPQSPRLRWSRQLGGQVTQGAVTAPDGTIYVGTSTGQLHAIDPRTGRDRWVFDAHGVFGGDLTTSPALLPDGTVLWPGPRSRLYVVGGDGRLRSSIQLTSTVLSPAVVDSTHFYLADMHGNLAAYGITSGLARQRWTLSLGDISYGSPVVAPDGTLRETVDDAVVAVQDVGDHGEERWRFTAHDISEVSAGVAPDGTTVFASNDNTVYGLDPGGAQKWSVPLGNLPYSSPSVTAPGTAVLGDNNGTVYVINTADGHLERTMQAATSGSRDGASVWSSPVVDAAGAIYYGTRDGHVYGYRADGTQLFDLTTDAAVYATGALTPDGGLVIGSQGGTLYYLGS